MSTFDVVLAHGSIRQVSENSHPELFFALRGGNNNFGIVTRLDLAIYSLDLVWGGQSYHTADNAPALFNATVNYVCNVAQDVKAAVTTSYGWSQEGQMLLAISQLCMRCPSPVQLSQMNCSCAGFYDDVTDHESDRLDERGRCWFSRGVPVSSHRFLRS